MGYLSRKEMNNTISPLIKLGFRCFVYFELQTDLHVLLHPNQSNKRSAVQ